MRLNICLLLMMFVLCTFSFPIWAQSGNGTILGVVKDQSGAVVAGANVTVVNTATGLSRSGTSETDGSYRFPALPVGDYEIHVTTQGFQQADLKGVTLTVGQSATFDISLQVGSAEQSVDVTSEVPLVDTTSSSVGSLVSEQKVADLPLNGRNWTDLSLLQPGVAQNRTANTTATGGVQEVGLLFSTNGAPTRSNNYMLDGAILQSMLQLNGASQTGNSLGVDGIKEYRVLTSMFSAEYPLTMGSQTVIVSKGGTNSFHGDAFEYLRNSALDARNYFDALDPTNARGFGTDKSVAWPNKRLPPFHRSNFGGAFGGPIRKDKTFVFAVYEGLREDKGLSVATTTIPSGCFDNKGVFLGASSETFIAGPGGCGAAAGGTVTMTPAVQQMLTQDDAGKPLNRAIFPSGMIFPAPNVVGTTFNFSYPAVQTTSENYGQLRLDQTFSANDSAFVRYTTTKADQVVPAVYPSEHFVGTSIATYITGSETHIFSPSFLQTARYSFSQTRLTNSTLLVAGASVKSLVGNHGLGSISPSAATGVTAMPAPIPGRYAQDVFTASDDLFWTRGRHALKMGFLWNVFNTIGAGVDFQRQGSVSFPNLASFFTGQYTSVLFEPAGTNSRRSLRYHTLGFYEQDDFRASQRLTLNLGLRYEFATVPCGDNYAKITNTVTAKPPDWQVANCMYSVSPSLRDISPRVGFAWDVFGNGRTALRGGAGIYYDVALSATSIQDSYNALPLSYLIPLINPAASPLTPTANSVGLLDPLVPAGGCAVVVNPTVPPCQQAVVQYLNPQQPTLGQWNLTIDRQLPWGLATSISYIGSAGWHLRQIKDGNYVNATIDANGNYIQPVQTDRRGLPIYCVTASDGTCAFTKLPAFSSAAAQNTVVNGLAFLRQNPAVGSFDMQVAQARSWYHSLQFVVNKRLTRGLEFQSSYTWAKLMDTTQGYYQADATETQPIPNGPTGVNANHLSNGLSALDLRQNWRFNALYHLPSPSTKSSWARPVQGWWLSTIVAIQSGYPFTPVITGNTRLLANASSFSYVPDRASSFNASTVITGTPIHWFDPTQFALPAAGAVGNAGRNYLEGPGLTNVDMSFNKDTKLGILGEQGALQFRAEVFNILNHPNFAQPNASIYAVPGGLAGGATAPPGQFGSTVALAPSPTAGQITATTTSSRQIQFALKVVF